MYAVFERLTPKHRPDACRPCTNTLGCKQIVSVQPVKASSIDLNCTMQTYTKQQRQGGGRYGARTLVGNWIEDVELQGSSIKDFLAKRETGRLKVDK